MEKVIVFGGSGFLGSHVADELTRRGYAVTIFDQGESPYLGIDQCFIKGDIMDYDCVCKAVEGFDYVYNFAGIADLDDATTRPMETVRLNVMGNINVVEATIKSGVKRYIYASSIYVYSEKGGFYRCSKQASEIYLEEYHRRFNLNYTVLRYGTLYGPRADSRNAIYRYITSALRDKQIICANPNDMREYINVLDAAGLSVDILSEEFQNQHIILTGHYYMKVKDMLLVIKEILNDDVEISFKDLGDSQDHYSYTPYSYSPKVGKKLVSNWYVDMGQGLLECINEIGKIAN